MCAQCTLCALIFVQAIDLAELCYNSQPHHAFAIERRFPELPVNDRDVAGLCESGRSQHSIIGASGRFCPHLSLLAKSRFSGNNTSMMGEMLRYLLAPTRNNQHADCAQAQYLVTSKA